MIPFEDEMTEEHAARTEAEYRAVTRQEIKDQRAADDKCRRQASIGAIIAAAHDLIRRQR